MIPQLEDDEDNGEEKKKRVERGSCSEIECLTSVEERVRGFGL